jgi:hypothetical protein
MRGRGKKTFAVVKKRRKNIRERRTRQVERIVKSMDARNKE